MMWTGRREGWRPVHYRASVAWEGLESNGSPIVFDKGLLSVLTPCFAAVAAIIRRWIEPRCLYMPGLSNLNANVSF